MAEAPLLTENEEGERVHRLTSTGESEGGTVWSARNPLYSGQTAANLFIDEGGDAANSDKKKRQCCGGWAPPSSPSVGYDCGEGRKPILIFSIVMCLIAFGLAVTSSVAASLDGGSLQNSAWSEAHSSAFGSPANCQNRTVLLDVDFYVGLRSVYGEWGLGSGAGSSGSRLVEWDGAECQDTFGSGMEIPPYCNDCRDASDTAYGTVVTGTVFSFGMFIATIGRTDPSRDSAGLKIAAVFSGVVSVALLSTALGYFVDRCTNNLPSEFTAQITTSNCIPNQTLRLTVNTDYKLGNGGYAIAFAIAFCFVSLVINTVVQTPGTKDPKSGAPENEPLLG